MDRQRERRFDFDRIDTAEVQRTGREDLALVCGPERELAVDRADVGDDATQVDLATRADRADRELAIEAATRAELARVDLRQGDAHALDRRALESLPREAVGD